jgi:carboxymethylenebutenolidase
MRLSRAAFGLYGCIFTIVFTMVLSASCAAAEIIPQELSVDGSGGAVAVTRYAAAGTASRPAVLVLHGAGGLDVDPQAYVRPASALAENGIDAYLVRYFGSGDRSCGCWDLWAETVANVTTAILRRPEASGRVGLLGFSLGGAVAVTSARDPRIATLVVFYGFVPNSQRSRIDRLPPVLVLHGDADDNVPLSSGQDIVSLARRLGGRAELVVYNGAGHRYSTWGETAAIDAIDRTIAFFRAQLIGS